MNDIEKANTIWQGRRAALTSALAGLKIALQRGGQRDITYYSELVKQAQQSEVNAYSDVKRLIP